MPPHIEIDSHHDDWHPQLAPSSNANDEPSPLFRSVELISPSTNCGLDRRLSNPNFAAGSQELVLTTDPKKDAVAAAAPVVVSRITAIIGPESAYVKKYSNTSTTTSSSPSTTKAGSSSSAAPAVTKTTAKAAVAPAQQKKTNQSPSLVKSPNQNNNNNNNNKAKSKSESKPIFLRASRYVSKKGWKVVKSLPKRVTSTVGSVKVPCHHRNVV